MHEMENFSSGELLHITLRFLKPEDVNQVKELCEEWFPIKYPNIWYQWITETDMFYALAALQGSTIIGLLVAQTKLLTDVHLEDQKILLQADLNGGNIGYILTLGVREPYRRLGLASLLLNQYIEHVRLDYYIKCQSSSSSNSSADDEQQSDTSEDLTISVEVPQNGASHSPREGNTPAQLHVEDDLAVKEVNSTPEERPASEVSPVALTNEGMNETDSFSSSVQDLSIDRSYENGCASRDSFDKTSVPSRTPPFSNNSFQNGSKGDPIFMGGFKGPEILHNASKKGDFELRKCSIPQLDGPASTCSLVTLKNNVEKMNFSQRESDFSSLQERTHGRDVKISILDSWETKSYSNGTPASKEKNFGNADINCNILSQTNACRVPLCACERFEGVLSSQGAIELNSREERDRGGVDSCYWSVLRTRDGAPTIYSSYIVESELVRGRVLERLRCSSLRSDMPITALLLHVLSSNSPAIAFYDRRKFARLAFLPKFYTINDVDHDGYSYIYYLNGSKAPTSFFMDSARTLALPRALGTLSMVPGRMASAVARWVSEEFGSRSNVVGSLMAGVVGVLEKMVAALVGSDAR